MFIVSVSQAEDKRMRETKKMFSVCFCRFFLLLMQFFCFCYNFPRLLRKCAKVMYEEFFAQLRLERSLFSRRCHLMLRQFSVRDDAWKHVTILQV